MLSERDEHHAACLEAAARLPAIMPTTWPVITEVAWLLRAQPQAIDRLFLMLDRGLLTILELDPPAFQWIPEFLRRYESIGAQLADASLVYLAERDDIGTIFTLDRRDFSVYRLKDKRTLRIVP